MNVINTIVYQDNPYNHLLYRGPSARYVMKSGTVADALQACATDSSQILHLHWEEGFLRRCRTQPEAEMVASYLESELQSFTKKGGRLVWTIHNALPHELEYLELFKQLRASIAACASRILVHNLQAISVLAGQCEFDRTKVALVPHPSYLGVYEAEADTMASEPDWSSQRIVFFGKIRRYKGIGSLLDALRIASDVQVDVIGEPLRSEAYADEVQALAGSLSNTRVELRRVEDSELPDLLRAYRGVVLPYERFLTSGVALAAMTFGRPIVAPDLPQMREIIPQSAQIFLYTPSDASDMAEKLRLLHAMPVDQLRVIRSDLLQRARYYRPARISERLFDLFDSFSVD